jgi:hypothetical protein
MKHDLAICLLVAWFLTRTYTSSQQQLLVVLRPLVTGYLLSSFNFCLYHSLMPLPLLF